LINLSGVYHYDARGATAERKDLFGSPIYRPGRPLKSYLSSQTSSIRRPLQTHASFSIAPVGRPLCRHDCRPPGRQFQTSHTRLGGDFDPKNADTTAVAAKGTSSSTRSERGAAKDMRQHGLRRAPPSAAGCAPRTTRARSGPLVLIAVMPALVFGTRAIILGEISPDLGAAERAPSQRLAGRLVSVTSFFSSVQARRQHVFCMQFSHSDDTFLAIIALGAALCRSTRGVRRWSERAIRLPSARL